MAVRLWPNKTFINFYTTIVQVSLKDETDVRLCVSATAGSAQVMLWYSIANFYEESIPLKTDAAKISDEIFKETKKLEEHKNKAEAFMVEEKENWKSVEEIDQKLLAILLSESIIVLVIFMAELFVIHRYIKSKGII